MDPRKLLNKIDTLLDDLVKNALELEKASFQVISEEEIAPLQSKQEKLVSEIKTVDAELTKSLGKNDLEKDLPARKSIHDKLAKFHELNAHFIDNLSNSHGLIKFEIEKIKKKKSNKSE